MSRRLLSAFFVAAGVNHFWHPRFYEAIVPPSLQSRRHGVVIVSGIAEIVGGAAVLPRPTRRLAGPYLVALLAAVFPANLYMASAPERFSRYPRWTLYARLPFQPLMMLWAWRATR
ncbi:MAG TPA: MauE/DoxX family redox-associated membrane protein [Solirubrobacteraceae bacterium]|nr:MauE/DoxX family redox-associated membrane protein [Solirubrobacteraceae bacterium]